MKETWQGMHIAGRWRWSEGRCCRLSKRQLYTKLHLGYAKHSRPRDSGSRKSLPGLCISKRMAQIKEMRSGPRGPWKNNAPRIQKRHVSNRIRQRGDRLYPIPHATAGCSPGGGGTARLTHVRHCTLQSGAQPREVEPGAIEDAVQRITGQ